MIVRIRVPRSQHRDRYVSAATRGLMLAFFGPATFSEALGLTPKTNPKCSGPGGGPYTCTIRVALSAGRYTATLTTFDQSPVGGKIPPTAHALSRVKNVAFTVARGKSNTLKFTLEGVPASIVVGGFPSASAGTPLSNSPFSVSVEDAGGFIIVGTYATPIVLRDGDTSGTTSITTTGTDGPPPRQLLGSNDTAAISYTGQPIRSAVITGTAGAVSGSGRFAVQNAVYFSASSPLGISNIPPGCRALSCTTLVTTLSAFDQIAVERSGDLVVGSGGGSFVTLIPAGCSSVGCTLSPGGGFTNAYGVALDAAGDIFVADPPAVKKVLPGCFSAGCVLKLGGGFNSPEGVAADETGDVFVADFVGAVWKVPPHCYAMSCVKAIGGTFIHPLDVAVDESGNVYVADFGATSIDEIPPGCLSAGCVAKLGGGFNFTYGVAVDALGNVYVADNGNNAVKEIPPGCADASCVITLVSGAGLNPIAIGTL